VQRDDEDDDARTRWFRAYGLSLIIHSLAMFLFVVVVFVSSIELPEQTGTASGDVISIEVAQSALPVPTP